MMELLTDPNAWASLLTLTILEIVLGIDNVIFISIVAGRLPVDQQAKARQVGLMLAMGMRIVLLCGLAWIVHLTKPLFAVSGFEVSWRDIIMVGGGLFLLVKGTREIHHVMEGPTSGDTTSVKEATFTAIILQILMLDVVFSLDSVITAVGMSDHLPVMITAVIISIAVMLFAAPPVSKFVHDHPTVKMLALSFLLLIGVALVADGLHMHIPKGYLYFGVAFSLGVEMLNLMMAKKAKKRKIKG